MTDAYPDRSGGTDSMDRSAGGNSRAPVIVPPPTQKPRCNLPTYKLPKRDNAATIDKRIKDKKQYGAPGSPFDVKNRSTNSKAQKSSACLSSSANGSGDAKKLQTNDIVQSLVDNRNNQTQYTVKRSSVKTLAQGSVTPIFSKSGNKSPKKSKIIKVVAVSSDEEKETKADFKLPRPNALIDLSGQDHDSSDKFWAKNLYKDVSDTPESLVAQHIDAVQDSETSFDDLQSNDKSHYQMYSKTSPHFKNKEVKTPSMLISDALGRANVKISSGPTSSSNPRLSPDGQSTMEQTSSYLSSTTETPRPKTSYGRTISEQYPRSSYPSSSALAGSLNLDTPFKPLLRADGSRGGKNLGARYTPQVKLRKVDDMKGRLAESQRTSPTSSHYTVKVKAMVDGTDKLDYSKMRFTITPVSLEWYHEKKEGSFKRVAFTPEPNIQATVIDNELIMSVKTVKNTPCLFIVETSDINDLKKTLNVIETKLSAVRVNILKMKKHYLDEWKDYFYSLTGKSIEELKLQRQQILDFKFQHVQSDSVEFTDDSNDEGKNPMNIRSVRQSKRNRNQANDDVTCSTVSVISGMPEPSLFVYPFENKHSIPVKESDKFRLAEGQFLNDVIIEFYLKYLDHEKNLFESAHVFNSFFYEKLTVCNGNVRSMGKNNPSNAAEAFQAVKSWTKNKSIFESKYLVVPINEQFHWYLAIIRNPGVLLKAFDPDQEKEGEECPSSQKLNDIDEDEMPSRMHKRTTATGGSEEKFDTLAPITTIKTMKAQYKTKEKRPIKLLETNDNQVIDVEEHFRGTSKDATEVSDQEMNDAFDKTRSKLEHKQSEDKEMVDLANASLTSESTNRSIITVDTTASNPVVLLTGMDEKTADCDLSLASTVISAPSPNRTANELAGCGVTEATPSEHVSELLEVIDKVDEAKAGAMSVGDISAAVTSAGSPAGSVGLPAKRRKKIRLNSAQRKSDAQSNVKKLNNSGSSSKSPVNLADKLHEDGLKSGVASDAMDVDAKSGSDDVREIISVDAPSKNKDDSFASSPVEQAVVEIKKQNTKKTQKEIDDQIKADEKAAINLNKSLTEQDSTGSRGLRKSSRLKDKHKPPSPEANVARTVSRSSRSSSRINPSNNDKRLDTAKVPSVVKTPAPSPQDAIVINSSTPPDSSTSKKKIKADFISGGPQTPKMNKLVVDSVCNQQQPIIVPSPNGATKKTDRSAANLSASASVPSKHGFNVQQQRIVNEPGCLDEEKPVTAKRSRSQEVQVKSEKRGRINAEYSTPSATASSFYDSDTAQKSRAMDKEKKSGSNREMPIEVGLDSAHPSCSPPKKKKTYGIRDSSNVAKAMESCKIIILDSLESTRPTTVTNLKQYLVESVKEKLNLKWEDENEEAKQREKIYRLIGGVNAKVPVQPNHCDCGVYLLMFVEKFFSDADHYSKLLLKKGPSDHTTDWFEHQEVSNKRVQIGGIIADLTEKYKVHEAEQKKTAKEEVKSESDDDALVELDGNGLPIRK